MIHVKCIACFLFCFILVQFYANGLTLPQLSEASTIYPIKAFNSNSPPSEQETNVSSITKIPDIRTGTYRKDCSNEIEVDVSSAGYIKENVDCVQDLIRSCKISHVYLLYATGSLSLRIIGLKNGSCEIDLVHEIERDSNSFSCMIPVSKLGMWESWKKGDGLDTLGNVTSLCTQT